MNCYHNTVIPNMIYLIIVYRDVLK